jgi:hypothetical protein
VDEQSPAPFDVDFSRASIARVYDYLLGGKEHLEVDRRAADAMRNVVPEVGEIAKDNRSFLRRGVRYLVRDAGIRQIVDIGSGLPSDDNVNEVAQALDAQTTGAPTSPPRRGARCTRSMPAESGASRERSVPGHRHRSGELRPSGRRTRRPSRP